MEFSTELRRKLSALQSAPVGFDSEQKCFVVNGKRKRGLTKLLKHLVPVPRCARIESLVAPEQHIDGQQAQFAGRLLARCGHCRDAVRLARTRSADECSLAERLDSERNFDRAHGLVIDHQIDLLVRHGRRGLFQRVGIVDPCVGTLIEQLDALSWSVVGSQVPVYQRSTDLATAIDLLATDRATRSQLHLIEIKASLRQSTDSRDNYERVRGMLSRSILRGLPQSYYSRHQLQLLTMNEMVHEQCSFRFDSASVWRVLPGTVVRYKLAKRFARRVNDLRLALGIKTGRVKRKQANAAVVAAAARKRARVK
jgi:hypothetical protein